MGKIYLGIDIGTTGVRAIAFNKDGFELEKSYIEYPLISDDKMKAELDPNLIFDSFLKVIKRCANKINKNNIQGMGLSTQMHSLMLTDQDNRPLTNVITWADGRANEIEKDIKNIFNYEEIYKKTGCRITHPSFPFSKIVWLKKKSPELLKKAKHITTIKGYIISKLYNKHIIDVSDASSMGLFNLREYNWDDDILKSLDIDRSYLPSLVECTNTLCGIDNVYLDQMGLDKEILFTIGSTDGLLANLGCGIFDNTKLSSTIGTSGAIRTAHKKPFTDNKARTWCYAINRDMYVSGGAINNGGITLRWLRDNFFDKNDSNIYKKFDEMAQKSKIGANELTFLPFLTGERSPYWQRNLTGGFENLKINHTKNDLVRSVMEGVMLNLFTVYKIISQNNNNIKTIIANGGYAKSDIWLQIQADIFNKEIKLTNVLETSALGASYLSMYTDGQIPNLNYKLKAMEASKTIKPIKENVKEYWAVYEKFIEEVNKKI